MLVGGLVVGVVPSMQNIFGCSQVGHLLPWEVACGREEP